MSVYARPADHRWSTVMASRNTTETAKFSVLNLIVLQSVPVYSGMATSAASPAWRSTVAGTKPRAAGLVAVNADSASTAATSACASCVTSFTQKAHGIPIGGVGCSTHGAKS